MTPQEIFGTVYKHLVTQGKQSRNDTGYCMYRSPEGLKCAVGCLIPDDLYQKEMDKGGGGSTHIAFILRKYPELPDWMRRHQDLLGELQFVHDDDSSWNYRSGFSDYGHNTMKRLAARHDLKFVSLEH